MSNFSQETINFIDLKKLFHKEIDDRKRPAVTYTVQIKNHKKISFLKKFSSKLFSVTYLEQDQIFGNVFCGESLIKFQAIKVSQQIKYETNLSGYDIWNGKDEEIIDFLLSEQLNKLKNPFKKINPKYLKGAYLKRLYINHKIGKKGKESINNLINSKYLIENSLDIFKKIGITAWHPNKNHTEEPK